VEAGGWSDSIECELSNVLITIIKGAIFQALTVVIVVVFNIFNANLYRDY